MRLSHIFFKKVNYLDETVSVGPAKDDEMCNFYLMYWVEGNNVMSQKSCFSLGPTIYSWDGWILGGGLNNSLHSLNIEKKLFKSLKISIKCTFFPKKNKSFFLETTKKL